MAATFLSNNTRNILNLSKSLPRLSQHSTILSITPFSSAIERAEGSNVVAEVEGRSDGGAVREGKSESEKDRPKRGVERADIVRDTAKETMDGAWVASRESAHKLQRDEHKQQTITLHD